MIHLGSPCGQPICGKSWYDFDHVDLTLVVLTLRHKFADILINQVGIGGDKFMKWSLILFLLISSIFSAFSCKQRVRGADPLARPTERKIIGPGVDYDPIGGTSDRDELAMADRLADSFEARRAHGWEVFRRVIRPVRIQAGNSSRDGQGAGATIPVFQTWYDAGEVQELFRVFYGMLREDRARAGGGRSREDLFNAAWASYHEMKSIDPDQNRVLYNRFQNLLGQISTDPERAGGLNGFGATAGVNARGVVLISPQLARAYIMNFEAVVRCQEQGSGAEGVRTRTDPGNRVAVSFSRGLQRFADDEFGACYGQPLPRGAVALKLTWARVGGPATVSKVAALANFDTGEAGIRGMLAKSGTWRIGDQPEDERPRTVPVPGFDGIYRVRVDNGHEWALTGIHVTTRETREWVWVSLWWGGDSPGSDFGADRPELCDGEVTGNCGELSGYYSPWNAYKMCVVSAWREGDPVLNAEAGEDFEAKAGMARWSPGLVAAARSTRVAYVHNRRTPDGSFRTWCSNPFIESDKGMANSNCVGCHQFATPGGAFNIPEHNHFDKVMRDFPADFLWSFDSGVEHFADRIFGVVKTLDGTRP